MRVYGFSKVDGRALVFSVNPNLAFVHFAKEGWSLLEEPDVLDAKIGERITEFHDQRIPMVVLEGGKDFIERYVGALTKPKIAFVSGSTQTLAAAGIVIADADWNDGDPPVDVDALVRGDEIEER